MPLDDHMKVYFEYLRDEGYRPELDDDGEDVISFDYQGDVLFLRIHERDPDVLSLNAAGFIGIASESGRQNALNAATEINTHLLLARVIVVGAGTDDEGVCSVGTTILPDPEMIGRVFPRLLQGVESGISHFSRVTGYDSTEEVEVPESMSDVIDTFFVKYVSYYTYGQKPMHMGEVEGIVSRSGILFQEDEKRRRGTTLQVSTQRIASVVAKGVVTRLVKLQLHDGSAIDISCKSAEGQSRIKAAISTAMRLG